MQIIDDTNRRRTPEKLRHFANEVLATTTVESRGPDNQPLTARLRHGALTLELGLAVDVDRIRLVDFLIETFRATGKNVVRADVHHHGSAFSRSRRHYS